MRGPTALPANNRMGATNLGHKNHFAQAAGLWAGSPTSPDTQNTVLSQRYHSQRSGNLPDRDPCLCTQRTANPDPALIKAGFAAKWTNIPSGFLCILRYRWHTRRCLPFMYRAPHEGRALEGRQDRPQLPPGKLPPGKLPPVCLAAFSPCRGLPCFQSTWKAMSLFVFFSC